MEGTVIEKHSKNLTLDWSNSGERILVILTLISSPLGERIGKKEARSARL